MFWVIQWKMHLTVTPKAEMLKWQLLSKSSGMKKCWIFKGKIEELQVWWALFVDLLSIFILFLSCYWCCVFFIYGGKAVFIPRYCSSGAHEMLTDPSQKRGYSQFHLAGLSKQINTRHSILSVQFYLLTILLTNEYIRRYTRPWQFKLFKLWVALFTVSMLSLHNHAPSIVCC